MAKFIDLPLDVLGEIARKLNAHEVAILRTACRTLCMAMDPFFYDCFVLDVGRVDVVSEESVLRDIAHSLESKWVRYARTLKIASRTTPPPQTALDQPAERELLVSALARLMNIRAVRWYVKETDPAWFHTAISEYLSRSTNLESLELRLLGSITASLLAAVYFGQLQRLTVLSWLAQPILADEASQLIVRSLTPSLTSLHLIGILDYSHIWPLLLRSNARLKHLTFNAVSPAFVAYLASYSGLETLDLVNFGPSLELGDAESSQLAQKLFNSVLPRHAASLVHLACVPRVESPWCFEAGFLDGLSSLHKLKQLTLSVSGRSVEFSVSEEANPVIMLLSAIQRFPELHTCTISSSAIRSAGCGTARIQHGPIVTTAIISVVERFRCLSASDSNADLNRNAAVLVSGIRYELRAIPDSDGHYAYTYNLEAQNPEAIQARQQILLTFGVPAASERPSMPDHSDDFGRFRFPEVRKALGFEAGKEALLG
ncbi:hypothetical protein C8F01DRAFT_770909 [Mycena amicta]|nr:hypothetical protein C8F01DRAFT_770909 [Mycena amicta]